MVITEDVWKGVIISESLEKPSLINEFQVYKAEISKEDEDIDFKENKGRWHLYWIYATNKKN